MKVFLSLICAVTLVLVTLSYANAKHHQKKMITKEEVLLAQKAWAQGIVNIGKSDNPEEEAMNHLDTLYAYDMGTVLFKPTKTSKVQFRGTKEEALSYFVTGIIEEDQGFALAPYTNVRFENEGIIIVGKSAQAMGNYYFTTTEGEEVKVEYTFGYIKDNNGNLKINIHHSSIPYQP